LRDHGHLTFLIGGARSGKSAYAETLTSGFPAPWRYVATAQAFDDEMRERIGIHRDRRRKGWYTVEAPLDLVGALAEAPRGQPVLIDCLTLWLSNHLLADHDVEAESERLAATLAKPAGPWFVVSNEVGLGIVPETPLGRAFRDAQGRLNQQVAAVADRVVLMVAGLPVQVK
jgi:adenosylcobinamide kinase/adenosylcobinamide-phosphate guanylyltransferase